MDKDNKAQQIYKKLEDRVVDGVGTVEDGIVDGYKKLEDGAMDGLNRLERQASAAEDFWVEKLFLKPGETAEQARQRMEEHRAQITQQVQQRLQELGEDLADVYLKIEDGVYTVYKVLESGALQAVDAVMDLCEEVFSGADDEPSQKDK